MKIFFIVICKLFKNIFTFFSDFKKNKLLRIIYSITTYITIFILISPIIEKFIPVRYNIYFNQIYSKYCIFALSILIIINNMVTFITEKTYLIKDELFKSKYSVKMIRTLFDLLSKYFKWEVGYRITLFIPKIIKNEEVLIPLDRYRYSCSPGIKKDRFSFAKNIGMPGFAWEKAWNGENYSGFLESLQISNVPEFILKNEKKLKKFFKDKYNIDDKLFNKLSNMKNKIKSYLSIGIVGEFSKLVAVIVVDSIYDSFADYEKLKQLDKGIIKHDEIKFRQLQIGEDYQMQKNSKKALSPNKNGSNLIEINPEFNELLENYNKAKRPQEKKEIFKIIELELSRMQRSFELDKFIMLFSLILKKIKEIIISHKNMESCYEQNSRIT